MLFKIDAISAIGVKIFAISFQTFNHFFFKVSRCSEF